MEWWNGLEGETKAFLCMTGLLVVGLVAIHLTFLPLFREQDKELRKYHNNQ
jgi:hypothetical protein